MKTAGKKLFIFLPALIIGIVIYQACKVGSFRSNYRDVNKLIHETDNLQPKPFLKAHLKNGEVCILRGTWVIDTLNDLIHGNGTCYDIQRRKTGEGEISIPVDSVAIFETNQKLENPESGRIAALTILAGLDIALGIYCWKTPKACFGSCPTFYINENMDLHYADAEGFSQAISPSLETHDIDALNNHHVTEDIFSLTMKNEALETHCIRDIKLLAFPTGHNERVYQSAKDTFYLCEKIFPAERAMGSEGDITSLICSRDRVERFSLADDRNLSSREELLVTFENIPEAMDAGLVISFRQTLMTTYFIYSAMGYMGDEVGDIFAELESDNRIRDKLLNDFKAELGNIDIYVWDTKKEAWIFQDGFYETGPIAFNNQILPLNEAVSGNKVHMKIVLNKGLWRIDFLGLTKIKRKVKPLEIVPHAVLKDEKADHNALANIRSSGSLLISMPGSKYKFKFKMPDSGLDYELFLYAQGYYLEWMRESWLQEKDLFKLRQMIERPKKYLRLEATSYKIYEKTMEQQFWNSRIDTENFSYDEN